MHNVATGATNSIDQAVWDGIQSLVDDYAHISRDDDVVIAYTIDVRESAAWLALALEQRGISAATIPMAPLRDPGFFKRLVEKIPSRREMSGRCVLVLLEWESVSHDEIIRRIFRDYQFEQYLVVRVINAGRNFFAHGMTYTPQELAAKNATVLKHCKNASALTVTTPGGTDLKIRLDQSMFRWVSVCGMTNPGKFLILPAGEVATFPTTVSGRLVADFALQLNIRTSGDMRLDTRPVTVHIEHGELIDYRADSAEIMACLDKAFSYPNARRVGELGFGTNAGIRMPVPENSPLNERCPGVHLGFGRHNPAVGEVDYQCDIHIDLIARGGTIEVDSSGVCVDLGDLPPSADWQSVHFADQTNRDRQDAYSPPLIDVDCCEIS